MENSSQWVIFGALLALGTMQVYSGYRTRPTLLAPAVSEFDQTVEDLKKKAPTFLGYLQALDASHLPHTPEQRSPDFYYDDTHPHSAPTDR